ncbi:hypothetical protein QDW14_09135 [Corynebacterium bovis]|nr:hypothetical protein [Corynebacterium bovis]MDH2456626.1 hypothetical protein [Corynebacterium bovis]
MSHLSTRRQSNSGWNCTPRPAGVANAWTRQRSSYARIVAPSAGSSMSSPCQCRTGRSSSSATACPPPGLGERHRPPPDLHGTVGGAHGAAECAGHELRPEAHAEHRPAGGEASADEFDLAVEVRVAAGVVEAEGRPEDDDEIRLHELREVVRGRGGVVEPEDVGPDVPVLGAETRPLGHRSPRPQILERHVAEHDQ